MTIQTNMPPRNDLQALGGYDKIQNPDIPAYDNTTGLLTEYGKSIGLKEVNPPNNIIPAGDLGTTGSQPITFPTSPTPTYGGLDGAIGGAIAVSDAQTQTEKIAQEAKAKDTAYQDLLKTMTGEVKQADYGAYDQTKAEKDRLNAELLSEQTTNRRQQEELRKNFRGTPAGLQDALGIANRESLSRQADLAVLKYVADNDFSNAKEILDRQVQMNLEQHQTDLATKKFIYEENKSLWSTDEQRQFDSQLKKEDAQLKKDEELQKQIADIKLEAVKNGAGADVLNALSKIDTSDPKAFDQALKAAGSSLAVSQNELTEVNGRKAIVNKKTGTVKYLDGSGSTIVQRIVNGSPVDGYTLVAGDDPYFIAQKYGTDTNGLKALNPTITDWNNIQVGATINVPSKKAGQTQALQTILGSGKFTKDQAAAVTNAINSGQDPFTVIKNNAKNIMGQTLTTDLDKAETALQQLNSLESSVKKFYANGGDTGVFSGNYEKTLNKLGETTDPNLAGLATEIALAMQAYRLAVTGTAASVQEDARIDGVFPGITSGEILNNARTKASIQSFSNKIDAAYRNTLGSAYDDLKTNSKPPVDPLQTVTDYGDSHPEQRNVIIQMQNDGVNIETISNWVKQQQ